MSDYEANLARIIAESDARRAKLAEEGVSDTPETDAELARYQRMRWTSQRKSAVSDLIPAEFARCLERERDDLLSRLTAIEHRMPEELARLERERDEAMRWQKEGQP